MKELIIRAPHKKFHDRSRVGGDKLGTYDKIVRNINDINNLFPEAEISVRINYTNKSLENIEDLIADLSNSPKISFFFQRIWQNQDKDEDINSQLSDIKELINSRGNVYEDRYYSYCRGNICYADLLNQSVVSYDGKLFKCTARDFAKDDSSVGYIDEEGNPIWNSRFYSRFRSIPFDNDKCRDCLMTPVCLGARSQKLYENKDVIANCNVEGKIKALENELYDGMLAYIRKYSYNDHSHSS